MKISEKLLKIGKNDQLEYNWKNIWKIPEFSVLSECKQSPKWHAEGCVKNHVMLVCNECLNYVNNNINGNTEYKKILLLAALFHDIGKGVTTFEKDGKWHAYGRQPHPPKGGCLTLPR